MHDKSVAAASVSIQAALPICWPSKVLGHSSSILPLRKKSNSALSKFWIEGIVKIALAGPAEFAMAQTVTTITARITFRPISIFAKNMAKNSGDLCSIVY